MVPPCHNNTQPNLIKTETTKHYKVLHWSYSNDFKHKSDLYHLSEPSPTRKNHVIKQQKLQPQPNGKVRLSISIWWWLMACMWCTLSPNTHIVAFNATCSIKSDKEKNKARLLSRKWHHSNNGSSNNAWWWMVILNVYRLWVLSPTPPAQSLNGENSNKELKSFW